MSCPVSNSVNAYGLTTEDEQLNDKADDIWNGLTVLEMHDAILELDAEELHDNILCKVAIMCKEYGNDRTVTAFDMAQEVERLLRPEMLKRAKAALDTGEYEDD